MSGPPYDASEGRWWPFQTYLLLECIDDSEYSALTTNQKEFLAVIISAGEIDFRDNTVVRAKVKATFGEESVTWGKIKLL